MKLRLDIRDCDYPDLSDLDWSGGSEHLHAVAAALQASYADEVAVLVVALPNGRLVGAGAVDFRPDPEVGVLWMLAVHERFQSLGIGRRLVRALEDRVRERGRERARLLVEHDNPRAVALYSRLGYRAVGAGLDRWPVAGGQTYVTAVTVLEHDLGPDPAG
ncbi:MAG: hypothetical protein JWP61_1336 [Friedmanniella sp.]|nr:hypothetical protein [Friedmanniella sp.]